MNSPLSLNKASLKKVHSNKSEAPIVTLSELLSVLLNNTTTKQKPTFIQLIEQSASLLFSTSDSAKLDTQLLLAFCLQKETSYLLTWPEKQVADKVLAQYAALLLRRIKGEPIAYLLGTKEFWSLPLLVSPATLIPRPDTETLVEQVLDYVNDESNKVQVSRCLDLGTGTGAIALALASEMPHWQIEAIDFNLEAVTLAQKNAERLNINNVTIYQSHWFDQIETGKIFDLIVSNPPYIDKADLHLTQGDVRYEPASALIAEQNGLADIIHIATEARKYLADGGILYFEHGFEQGLAVRNILKNLAYKKANTTKDLSGNDRITSAVFYQTLLPSFLPNNK